MHRGTIAHGRRVRRAGIAGLGCAMLVLGAAPGLALEEPPGEMEALKACEARLCSMILGKEAKGDDLKCDVQKTWAKSTLEEGKSKGVSWGFGDARCNVDLKLARREVVSALTLPKYTVRVPAHDVKCVVEREGELKPVTARLAPKLTFKNGLADKVWINLESIEGPTDVKSTIWTAANLEDTLGIFHRPIVKSINKFMHRQCARRYGPAEAKAERKKKKKGEGKSAAAAEKKDAVKADAAKKDAPQKDVVGDAGADVSKATASAP